MSSAALASVAVAVGARRTRRPRRALGDVGGVGFGDGGFERGARGADAAGADPPARGREAVTGAGDRDNARVSQGKIERVGPVAVDDHGAGEQHVEQTLDFFVA